MKLLHVFASLFALASARPDVSHLLSNQYLPTAPEQSVDEEQQIYFYGNSDDDHFTEFNINVKPQSKKNTKVLFVKTPHHAGVVPNVEAPKSLVEDKTKFYVLLKNPVLQQSISIPTELGVKQVEPEVYFIKYKTKQEADAEVQDGLRREQVGTSVPLLTDKEAFINALGDETNESYQYDKPDAETEDDDGEVEDEENFTEVRFTGDQNEAPGTDAKGSEDDACNDDSKKK